MVPTRQLRALGVVVPVHNEESVVTFALEAILDRAVRRLPSRVDCRVAVVLDTCEGQQPQSGRSNGQLVRLPSFCAAGAETSGGHENRAVSHLFRPSLSSIALRSGWRRTDADSIVPEEWLRVQVAAFEEGVDVWAGRVGVADWTDRTPGVRIARWKKSYALERNPISRSQPGIHCERLCRAQWVSRAAFW